MKIHPPLMYGTAWKEAETKRLVASALRAGFRAVDTANQRRHYFEAAVGEAVQEAIASGVVSRSELFLQTKFTYARSQDARLPYDPHAPHGEQVKQSFASSLEHLHTDYVDSYILHGPSSSTGIQDVDWEVWRTMEGLARSQRARAIGVSNIRLEQLSELYEGAEIKPSYVQNRCYARDQWDLAVRNYCRERGIVYEGFSLLTANREVPMRESFQAIMKRTNRTASQLIFRFAVQVGMLPLTGTSSEAHMKEDLQLLDFQLSPEEIAVIERG